MRPPTKHALGEGMVWRSLLALGVVGGALSSVFLDALMAPVRAGMLERPILCYWVLALAAVTTFVLYAAALRVSLDQARPVVRTTLVSCVGLGWLNCPLAMAMVSIPMVLTGLLGAPGPEVFTLPIFAAVFGVMFGAVTAAPLGALYGAGSLFAVRELRALRARPSHDAGARAAWAVGVTVALASIVATVVALVHHALAEPLVPAWVPALLAAAGVLVAMRSRRARRRRDRLLLQVALEGEAGGFVRVPLHEVADAHELLPWSREVDESAAHALLRVVDGRGAGAYRSADGRVPWALIG